LQIDGQPVVPATVADMMHGSDIPGIETLTPNP